MENHSDFSFIHNKERYIGLLDLALGELTFIEETSLALIAAFCAKDHFSTHIECVKRRIVHNKTVILDQFSSLELLMKDDFLCKGPTESCTER